MCRRIAAALAAAVVCSSANAALLSRMSGQAYYDDVLDVTWVADANLAKTSGYSATGQMNWAGAQAWIASLNAANDGLGYLGVNDWRLPAVTDTGAPGCDFAFSGTDCGFNVDLATGEMANLYYGTLGNTGGFTTAGASRPCLSAWPSYCVSNAGPFSNLMPDFYWSGTQYAPDPDYGWAFIPFSGYQLGGSFARENYYGYAWAVRAGDIAAVPVPAAAGLLGCAVAALGAARRRLRTGPA